MRIFLFCCLLIVCAHHFLQGAENSGVQRESLIAAQRLAPVKTDHPRDTLRSFMQAMDRYVRALDDDAERADDHLAQAVRCLDLSQTNPVGREALGREAAKHLKEVIDRVIIIEYDKVPDDPGGKRWRLRHTEIVIHRVEQGDRAGEHLFSPDTVARASEFYQRVRDLPLLPGTLGGGIRPPWHDRYIPHGLKGEVFGVAYWQWIVMTVLIFVGLVVRHIVKAIAYIVQGFTARTRANWDDQLVAALKGPITHLGTTGVWFASLHALGITGTAYTVISLLIKGAFFINVAYLAYNLAGFLGNQCEQRLRSQHPELNPGILALITQTLKILALIFCLLLGAENMGFNVAGLIAGLGIGGLAVALAAKDTLANLLGSVMIMIDRPFRMGDYIVARGVEGTVEKIGFRSTRIRTLANSLVSIPNAELALANIDNLGMREYRRIRETYNLVFGTPTDRIIAFCSG
ncbi:MAG: mechanosensitive ion channel family protein, partial [Planctomycetes bacterium]|nr:mechanosensitive ion channel family protein [Planctomycetota bacterium]